MNVNASNLLSAFICMAAGAISGGMLIPLVRSSAHPKIRPMLLYLALCAALGAAAGCSFPLLRGLTYSLLFSVLAAVSFTDAYTQEIPDSFHLMLIAIGILSCVTVRGLFWWERLAGIFCVSVPLLLLSIWKEGAFGGGDIKLVACCGLILGLRGNLIAAFLAILCGGAYGIWLLCAHKAGKQDHFAFGPFLCVGIAASVFWGQMLLNWYLSLCGFVAL